MIMMKSKNIKESVISAAFTIAIATVLLVMTFDGEITGFFRIGDVLPLSPFVNKESVRVVQGEIGYDGQYFLTIALDPTLDDNGTINALDNPKYRYKRIGFPLAGYILGLGNPKIIPYALVGLNLACITGLVLLISLFRDPEMAEDMPLPSALWILAFPGVWVCLTLTTAELFGSLLFVAALFLFKDRRYVLSAVVLAGACFTRETYLATVVVLAGLLLFQCRAKFTSYLLLGAIPPLAWFFFVNSYIQKGTTGVHENLALPFTGINTKIRSITGGGFSNIELFEGLCFAILLITAALLAISVVRSRASLSIAHIVAFPIIAILVVSKMQILEYHAGYLRVFLDIWIILLLVPGAKWFRYARTVLLLLSGIASFLYVLNYTRL